MQKDYPIGEAARRSGLTIEALRHYHRIGLLCPHRIDPLSGYRYYSEEDIAALSIIQYLRSINLSLPEIHRLISNRDGIAETIRAIGSAKEKVREQMEKLKQMEGQLDAILKNYSTKFQDDPKNAGDKTAVRTLPARSVFLVPQLEVPSLSNLQKFPRVVESCISPEERSDFQFQNAVGFLCRGQSTCLFASCIRCKSTHPNVFVLPAGRYLVGFCAQAESRQYLSDLKQRAAIPSGQGLLVLSLVFTGLIQWDYQAFLYLGKQESSLPL